MQAKREHGLEVGSEVEVRAHDRHYVGGWFRARILQVQLASFTALLIT
jgi:hypothetical protein